MTPRGAVCTCAGGLMGLPAAHRGTCQTDGTNVRIYFQPATESPVAFARTGMPTQSPTTPPTSAPADSGDAVRAASATGDDDDGFEWWWIVIGALLFLAVFAAFLVVKRSKAAEGAESRAAPGFMNMSYEPPANDMMTLGGLEHTYATVPEAARGDGVAINSTYASVPAATGTIEPNYAGAGADPDAAYTDVAPASASRYTPEPAYADAQAWSAGGVEI